MALYSISSSHIWLLKFKKITWFNCIVYIISTTIDHGFVRNVNAHVLIVFNVLKDGIDNILWYIIVFVIYPYWKLSWNYSNKISYPWSYFYQILYYYILFRNITYINLHPRPELNTHPLKRQAISKQPVMGSSYSYWYFGICTSTMHKFLICVIRPSYCIFQTSWMRNLFWQDFVQN